MEMFDHRKQADEAAVPSAQGMERKVNEGPFQQAVHSRIQESELARPGLPIVRNRQGYCNCCHVHYRNLEQHIYSSQHRRVASYCRNHMGTTSLMERFLQDVLQHHPYRYHDNRPTYDDIPLNSQLLPRDGALLSAEVPEKDIHSGEEPSIDGGFVAESGCLISRRDEKLKKASVTLPPTQTLERRPEQRLGASQQTMDTSSNIKNPVPTGILTESHEVPFTTMNLLPQPLSINHLPPTFHGLAKNIRYSVIPDLVSGDICEQTTVVCSQNGFLNANKSPILQPVQSKTVSHLHKSPVCNKGKSFVSGQLFLKQDDLQPQDETQSNFCLRNTRNPVGTSSSLTFQETSQVSGRKEENVCRSTESSINEIIEEVILKYCYEPPPKELPCREEDTNSCVSILSLLDLSSMHGSDTSFNCDAAVEPGAFLPNLTLKNLELLKDVQVNLQDENYDTQLTSIFKNVPMQPVAEAEKDVSGQNEEPVLPALPHVPPSFVGKTWSRIMYEDDMKIEALVRDFREGRFRCHFDTESLANGAPSQLRKGKQNNDERISVAAANPIETMSVKEHPEFTDGLSDGPDFSNLSATSDTHVSKAPGRPKKRIWRLASRCQVVKVSRGTQTNLVHYSVIKQKFIRKNYQLQDQKANLLWSENEKTPTMKTRLCALKLPESYAKIMSPIQPQTIVYVLSCPEMKQFRSKAEDVSKIRRHNSTDSKDSVRYKYKQTTIKYYDPLTNRVLKTPPKCIAGEKARKPPHARQLFRNLNLDGNGKKQADVQYLSKAFNSPDICSSAAASFMLDPNKKNDINPSHHNADQSSVSMERPECLVCNSSAKCCKHLFLSPLNSQQEGDFQFTPFNRKKAKRPLKSHTADCLERDNPKTMWLKQKVNSRESGFSKKRSGLILVRRDLVKKGRRRQPPRSTAQQAEGKMRKFSSALKSSMLGRQTKKTTLAKHHQKETADTKKLTVSGKPTRAFLNTAAGGSVRKRGRKPR